MRRSGLRSSTWLPWLDHKSAAQPQGNRGSDPALAAQRHEERLHDATRTELHRTEWWEASATNLWRGAVRASPERHRRRPWRIGCRRSRRTRATRRLDRNQIAERPQERRVRRVDGQPQRRPGGRSQPGFAGIGARRPGRGLARADMGEEESIVLGRSNRPIDRVGWV